MDQCAEVPSAEVVSVIESDSCEMTPFERLPYGHAILHNTPCRHFAGRLTLTCGFALDTNDCAACLWAHELVITTFNVSRQPQLFQKYGGACEGCDDRVSSISEQPIDVQLLRAQAVCSLHAATTLTFSVNR